MKITKSILSLLLACSLTAPSVGLFFKRPTVIEALPPDSTVQTPLPPTEEPPSLPQPPEEVKPTVQEYIRCVGDSVNIRSGAGKEFSVVGIAEKGTAYALIGKVGSWYKTYYRGKVAYLSSSYATLFTLGITDNEKVESVLEEGYKHIGVPYVYGAVRLHDGKGNLLKGFTAQKFDCSSLVQYMFYKGAGKLLQVTTRTQVVQGKFVKKSDLQPGDCMYFTNASRKHLKGTERIGHVAVYLGNNYILHTASDYARIEEISSTRWGYYIESRRFV